MEDVVLPEQVSPGAWGPRTDRRTDPSPDGASRNPMQVDLIVSEWMGYCLLYGSALPHPRPPTPATASAADSLLTSRTLAEGMLESVLYARDRWLKPVRCSRLALFFMPGL